MISDTLAYAVSEIRECLDKGDHSDPILRLRIEDMLRQMDKIRRELDFPVLDNKEDREMMSLLVKLHDKERRWE